MFWDILSPRESSVSSSSSTSDILKLDFLVVLELANVKLQIERAECFDCFQHVVMVWAWTVALLRSGKFKRSIRLLE